MKKIPLIYKGNIIDYAMVDDEDYQWLSEKQWRLNTQGYAYRMEGSRKTKKYVWMHKAILEHYGVDYSGDKVTHHINHNKLDNQKCNIEAVSRTLNQQSRHRKRDDCYSKYKGVSYYPNHKLWRAALNCDGKTVFCQYFKTEDDAGYAYNYYATKYHKEYAILNKLPSDYIENPEILKVRGKGISLRPSGTWEAAMFNKKGNYIYLGRYNTEIEAEIAYNNAAIEEFGESAVLNEIPEEYSNVIPMRNTRGGGTSKYRGIHYNTKRRKWIAHSINNGTAKYIGGFDTETEALNAQTVESEVSA